MCAPTTALAAFEVAVAGGSTAFAGFQAVGIHGEAHGATRFAPFKTSGEEDFIEAFFFCLFFYQAGAGYYDGFFDTGRFGFAFYYFDGAR